MKTIRECLEERILIMDGAMGTFIQQKALDERVFYRRPFASWQVSLAGNNDVLNLTAPEVIADIHERYVQAGADIISTNTFSANRISQREYGCAEQARLMAYEGARIARRVADETNSRLSTLNSPTSSARFDLQVKELSTLNLYNKHQNYKLYMIPALLAIVMMLMTGFLPTLNIVGEKESGTIEQINVTPVSKWAFILSKLIPFWIIALFVVTVCLVLSWLIYGLTPNGPLWLVYVLAMLLALFFSALGLIISNYSDTMQQAIFVMWFFIVCIMLLSGLFTPTRSMPDWAYLTTYVNPMHYFIDAIRTVFIRGGGFYEVAHQVLALLAIGLFMALCAVQSYKKNC